MRPPSSGPRSPHPALSLGGNTGQLWRPVSVHNPAFPAPTPMLPRDTPASDGAAMRAECGQGLPARRTSPTSTDNLRDTHISSSFVSAAGRDPRCPCGWQGTGAPRAPTATHGCTKWLPSCFLSKKEDAALWMDGCCPPRAQPLSPLEWPSGRSSLGHGALFPAPPHPESSASFRLAFVPFPKALSSLSPKSFLFSSTSPCPHGTPSALPELSLTHGAVSVWPPGSLLSPEVLRATPKLSPPSCSASQSSGRAAGKKDVVRL